MLDLDGPLSRRTGEAYPCAGGTAPGARTGGERGTISLIQSRSRPGSMESWTGGEGRGPGQGRGVPRMGQASMGVADWQLDEVDLLGVWNLWMQPSPLELNH
jgi:hypothetical protein